MLPPRTALTCSHVGDAPLGHWLCADYVSLTFCHVAEVGVVTMTGSAFSHPMVDECGEAKRKFETS